MRNNFFKSIDLLHLAKKSGIRIVLKDDQLQLSFEKNTSINNGLLEEIKLNKKIIIEYLGNKNKNLNKVNKNHQIINAFERNSYKHIPLSFSQERLWFIDQLEGSVQYHLPTVLRLKGRLNIEALEFALQQIVDRHEVLRTLIGSEDGEPYQYFKPAGGWQLSVSPEVLSDENILQDYINELIDRPFDLGRDYMLRAGLVKTREDEHVLVVTLHHIASDAWSVSVIVKEVAELYRIYTEGRQESLPPLSIQYADYAIWQRNYLRGEVLEQQLTYWKDKLAGVAALQLPCDYARPSVQGTRGAVAVFSVDKELSEQLRLFSRQQGATLFMTLLAVFKVLLYRYSGQQDICVGTPIAGRRHQQIEELIGFFINTLALRSNLTAQDSFIELLQQVRATTLAAYDHQEVPFEKLVEALVKERDRSRAPLFQVMFILQNTPEVPSLQLGDVQLSRESSAHHTAKFELTFNISQTPKGIQGAVEYCTDLFTESSIRRMIEHFKELLHAVVATPTEKIGKLQMLSMPETQQLLGEFNHTGEGQPQDNTFLQLFEEQVLKYPDNTAAVFGKSKLTYSQLNERSNQLAHYLHSKGVREETLVPVCIERSIDMLTAILGILKAGGAYVPVDPEFPEERIGYLLQDIGSETIVSNKKNKARLVNSTTALVICMDDDNALFRQQPLHNLSINIQPHHLAYVIYTSGSTGKPKGVMIEHHNLLSYLLNDKTNYCTKEGNNAGSFIHLSYTFDASLTAMFMPLLSGKAVVIGSKTSVDIFEDDNLQQYAPYDFIKLTPAHLELIQPKMLLANGTLLTNKLVIGGEALLLSQLSSFAAQGMNVNIVNEYGPTEATVGCSLYSFDTLNNKESLSNSISIGRPIDGVQIYILGESEELIPIGVAGELCIAGAGLARGYLNRADLTDEKFVPNAFSTKPGTKMYKTGDLAKWLPNGNIEYLGRKDEQVKIRGYRIELGEIESVLNENEHIKQAVVLARIHADGNKRLTAYIVPVDAFDKASVVAYLSSKLPDYMVPVQWVTLEGLPLTINGKINRAELPDPAISELLSNAYVAPRNSLEAKLVNMWQQLLHVPQVGIHDNFFELGGHSLLVMRLVSAIRKELAVEIPVKSLFNHPTIASLVLYLQEVGEVALLPHIEVLERPAHIPLSFSQERLWFIDQLGGTVQYHIPIVLKLAGTLNREALVYALQQLVNRHEVLRTVIREKDGIGYQYIKEPAQWQLYLSSEQDLNYAGSLQKYISMLIQQPFDLSKDDMFRASLVQTGDKEHVLIVTMHHIASDAWSLSIIVKEVVEFYNNYETGQPADLPVLTMQYADYSIWQRNYLQGKVLEDKMQYWQRKLTNLTTLELPTDFKRPAVQSNNGAKIKFTTDKELTRQLNLLSRQNGTTMFMTLLAAFKVLLYRYSGQVDICVGTPIAGRQQHEIENLAGFFINTLALRSQLSNDLVFKDFLQQVRTTTFEAYEHQEIPFEKIVDAVVTERDKGRNPVFQVMLTMQNAPKLPELKLGEIMFTMEETEHLTAQLDLVFNITETPNGLSASIEYCTDLYHQATIRRMTGHFVTLLHSIVLNPAELIGSLEMLSPEDIQQQLEVFNNTEADTKSNANIVELFEATVTSNPGKTAVVFEQEKLSFLELNKRANQLGAYLIQMGVRREQLVPICIDRSVEMLIGILAILKAGAVYVPIDPEYPVERVNYILEDTKATCIVAGNSTVARLPKDAHLNIISIDDDWVKIGTLPAENLSTIITATQLAYIIYTSGSTGKPKGVMIEHGQMLSYLLNDKTNYITSEVENTGSFIHLSYTFDASLTAMFMPLLAGKTVVIGSSQSVEVFEDKNLLKYAPYDFIKITPSHIVLLQPKMKIGGGRSLTKQLVLGGEALFKGQFSYLLEEGIEVEIINEYGPTEATVGCSTFAFSAGIATGDLNNSIPIGKPIDNVQLRILGPANQLLPLGAVGELCIGGAGLARGYLNLEGLSKEKFINDPFSKVEGARMYKSGDLARWLPDGNIEYVGRKDEQVKIRGYRIELGEIEGVLQECVLVSQAVVIARESKDGIKRLLAYVVPAGEFDREATVAYLKAHLPVYMMPSLIIQLDCLPLTVNGKVDRKSLPDPEFTDLSSGLYVPPRNEIEAKLVGIWQEVLEVERIGINDNFFELGGHSLLAMRLRSAIRKAFEVEMPIGYIFDHPSIEQLALQLAIPSKATVLPAIDVQPRPKNIPLSFSQERLWFIDQLEGSLQYHLPTILRLKGRLNVEGLIFALQQLINRHEILRTVIREMDGEGYQYIQERDGWKIKITEGAVYNQDQDGLKKYVSQIISLPFNLSEDYMLRAELILLNEEQNLLVVTMHHIASDGWSTSIIVKELMELYLAFEEDRESELVPLKIQYADYALWQRNYLQGELLNKKLGYWKQQLEGVVTLQLPTDYQRPAVQSNKGATAAFVLDEAVTDKLRLLSQQQGATMFMTLLAAFKVLLYRYSGQQDICVGTPIAGRPQQELESLAGFFINTLALRNQINGNGSFIELLQQVRATTLQAYEHQDIPFEKVVDIVVRERDMGTSPVFQAMFIMQNTPNIPEFRLGQVVLEKEPFDHTSAKFDITFYLAETPFGLQGIMEYRSDLFTPVTIERMLVHFNELLKAVTITPGKPISSLPMLTSEEQHELITDFNNTKEIYPDGKTLIGLFEEQVAKTPNNIAVIFEDRQISFRQLNELSNQFAHCLRSSGVKEGALVPICIERCIDMVTGILGILKAGAVYVPIDADYPKDRIRFMLEDTGAATMVTNRASDPNILSANQLQKIFVDQFNHSENWPVHNLSRQDVPDSVVAITYTSGSSGKPKGVCIYNAGIVNRLHWMWNAYPFGKNEVCALKTSIGFVDHMWELYGPLAKGVTTILFKKEDVLDLDILVKKLSGHMITRWVLVPSLLRVLLDKLQVEKITLNHLRYWSCSGEAITRELIQNFYKIFPVEKHKLLNIYGSSEMTADITCYDTSEDFISMKAAGNHSTVGHQALAFSDNENGLTRIYNKVPIGKPIANSQVFIVDKAGQLVAKGVTGEILVGGVQVAKGYLNLPDLSAEKFISNPFTKVPGDLLYKSGDLGCWLNCGNIAYLGRKDDQVKIRGHRIEPGEIETVLLQSELVKDAVVLAKNDPAGDKRLVCYVVLKDLCDKKDIQSYLKSRLPEFMIPGAWVMLEKLPLTHNGKLDKNALPEPGDSEMIKRQYVAPGNELESNLVNIWQEILNIGRVGIADNFFELGGHSLLAIRLVSAIRKKLQLEITVNDIFIYPTIEAFTGTIFERVKNPSLPVVNIKHLVSIKTGGNKLPLYIVCGAGGTALRFKNFSAMMDDNQPVYVLQPPLGDNVVDVPDTIEEIARVFIEEILIHNPNGPYALSGHCLGGVIAFEMAKQLIARGRKIHLLAMFDTIIGTKEKQDPPTIKNLYHIYRTIKYYFRKVLLKFDFETFLLRRHTRQAIRYKVQAFTRLLNRVNHKKNIKELELVGLEVFDKSFKAYLAALKKYKIVPYEGDIVLFYAKEHYYFIDRNMNVSFKKLHLNEDAKSQWKRFAKTIKINDVTGEHSTIFDTVHGDKFAMLLQKYLDTGVHA
ncbi:MAG: amino acid adenylation domain-containing protein [Ferruginibacter sp.]